MLKMFFQSYCTNWELAFKKNQLDGEYRRLSKEDQVRALSLRKESLHQKKLKRKIKMLRNRDLRLLHLKI
jgi:hypothetical protein